MLVLLKSILHKHDGFILRCYKSVIGFLFFTLMINSVISAQTIDSDAFFNKGLNRNIEVINAVNETVKIPWIEELDLRTETTDFDPQRQEYTLRFSPSSPRIRKTNKALINHYNQSLSVQDMEAFEDLNVQLYLDWINLHFLEKERALLSDLDQIWEDKKTLYKKQLGILKINFDDLIQLEVNKNKLTQSRFEFDLEKADILASYEMNGVAIDNSIISMENIESQIGRLLLENSSIAKVEDPKTAYERAEIKKEMALEEAEKRKYLDFVQVKYRGQESFLFEETFSLGLGLTLDNSVSRKLKMAKLKMAERKLDTDAQTDGQERAIDIATLHAELKHHLKLALHYSQLKTQEESNLNNIADLIRKQVTYDPGPLLDIKEHIVEGKAKEIKYQQDVYIQYVKLLKALGKLQVLPFVNYLRA